MELKKATLLATIGSFILLVENIWALVNSITFAIKYPDSSPLTYITQNAMEVIAVLFISLYFLTLYRGYKRR